MHLNAQHRHRHGITIEAPISKRTIKQVGILYVDDTNLWAGLDESLDDLDTCQRGQEGIEQWGTALMATGGALNPAKCAWTIHDMTCSANGEWHYRDDLKAKREAAAKEDKALDDIYSELDDVNIQVPQLGGDAATIQRLKTSEAVKNLGLKARPDGSSQDHFQQLQKRMKDWTLLIKNGQLPTRSVWASYTHQLWAGMRYRLGACSATINELSDGLGSSDFYLISSLGVVRSIKKQWRYLPAGFGGMGLEELTTSTAAATINSFLQHYQMDTALGITLTAAIENLQLELGVRDCPFKYD